MTRYTNLGRKRTYVEAGLAGDRQENHGSTGAVATLSGDEPIDNDASTEPVKQRKRTKHKEKLSADDVKDGPKNTSAQGEGTTEDQEVKKAYMNREKNRKNEAARVALSEKRRQKRGQEKLASTTCFACREKGHAAKDCPNVKPGSRESGGTSTKQNAHVGLCYRCGSLKHNLSRCRKAEDPDNPLPYALCFVCSGKGHLASSCPKNKDKGVYPYGGCCKLCRETSHLARNCPLRKQDNSPNTVLLGTGHHAGADEDDFHTFKRINAEVDREERGFVRVKKKADMKMGVMSKTVKSFAEAPPVSAKKKVVVF